MGKPGPRPSPPPAAIGLEIPADRYAGVRDRSVQLARLSR